MQPLKRKTPSGVSPSPGPGPSSARSSFGVKAEPMDHDGKRQKVAGPTSSLAPNAGVPDMRTATAGMSAHLKTVGTLGYQDAYFHSQAEYPAHDPSRVLELLKRLERVVFNEVNQVFSWIPELTLANEAQIRTYLRTNTTANQGVNIRTIREALPPNGLAMLEDLEKRGEILVMRALTGQFKDVPLPKLGKSNVHGLKINESNGPAGQRFRTIWWDELRERGRSGQRVDEDFVTAWDSVPIAETDDIMKLLERENLAASSNMPAAPKVTASAPVKKKKATRRPLKITNTHMKAQGIDFSKDYERPS